jgi:nucleotide-binding universal stress UspA family protein
MSTTTDSRRRPDGAARGGPERILVAVDRSAARFAVLRWVADRAARHSVAARVVTVTPARQGAGRQRSTSLAGDRVVWDAREYLTELQPKAAVTVRVLEGDRERMLMEAAADADLLVLGAERRPAALGPSFSTRLAERAECPVVVVPKGWSPRPGAVVVGVTPDGSDRRARDFAITEALRRARPLLLVHAWHLPWILDPVGAAGLDSAFLLESHREWLEGVRAQITAAEPGLHVATVFAERSGVAALLDAGKDASLVVVGTHRLGMLERLLLGSVGRRVLAEPPCPVAVVPPSGR